MIYRKKRKLVPIWFQKEIIQGNLIEKSNSMKISFVDNPSQKEANFPLFVGKSPDLIRVEETKSQSFWPSEHTSPNNDKI